MLVHIILFINRVCEVWNTLPSSVVEAPSFSVFSDYWNMLI